MDQIKINYQEFSIPDIFCTFALFFEPWVMKYFKIRAPDGGLESETEKEGEEEDRRDKSSLVHSHQLNFISTGIVHFGFPIDREIKI